MSCLRQCQHRVTKGTGKKYPGYLHAAIVDSIENGELPGDADGASWIELVAYPPMFRIRSLMCHLVMVENQEGRTRTVGIEQG